MNSDGGQSAAVEARLRDLIQQRELRRCGYQMDWEAASTDEKFAAFKYFCENYAKIRHPLKGIMPFTMRPAQEKVARMWIEHRFTINLKARQVGFSTLLAVYVLWCAMFWPNRTILLISRGKDHAKQLLGHSLLAFRQLPRWMEAWIGKPRETQEVMEFQNGSELLSFPSASDPARGFTGWLCVVDELGQLPNSEQAWASIEPTADIGGQILMQGTARGEGNLFHQLWTQAEAGQGRFTANFTPWSAVPERTQEWFDQQCRDLPSWQRAQEYPETAEEAFLRSGRPVFDGSDLPLTGLPTPIKGGLQHIVEGDEKRLGFVEGNDLDPLAVYKFPQDEHRYAIGVDVAEGLEHGDFTAAHVVDTTDGEVAAVWHGHIHPRDLASVVADLGAWYNRALVCVESNNHGLTTLTWLQDSLYHPLYHDKSRGQSADPSTVRLGFRTSRQTKGYLIDEVGRVLRASEVKVNDEATIRELRAYQMDGKGGYSGRPHDDLVMSFALALEAARWVHHVDYRQPDSGPKPGTMAWIRMHHFGKKKVAAQRSSVIGGDKVYA